MTRIDRLETEKSLVSNLMRDPQLISKLKLTPEMFENEHTRKFIEYVLDVGKVDVNEIYYKCRNDKEF
ncbi:damage-inducible protein, partial [Staphylococcus chromogenes]